MGVVLLGGRRGKGRRSESPEVGPVGRGCQTEKKFEPEVLGPRGVGAVQVEGGLGGCSFWVTKFGGFFFLFPTPFFQFFF